MFLLLLDAYFQWIRLADRTCISFLFQQSVPAKNIEVRLLTDLISFLKYICNEDEYQDTIININHILNSYLITYQEIFSSLPLPYTEEEFKIDINWKDGIENKSKPPPYVHIRRSILSVQDFTFN